MGDKQELLVKLEEQLCFIQRIKDELIRKEKETEVLEQELERLEEEKKEERQFLAKEQKEQEKNKMKTSEYMTLKKNSSEQKGKIEGLEIIMNKQEQELERLMD